MDFDSLSGVGGSGASSGQPSNAVVMQTIKQQIAVANAQELLSVSGVDLMFYWVFIV